VRRSIPFPEVLRIGAIAAYASALILFVVFFVDPTGPVSYNAGLLVALVGSVLFYASRSRAGAN